MNATYVLWGEEMSILTKTQQKELIRAIYRLRMKDPRMKTHEMARNLGVVRNTAYEYEKRAKEQGILFSPQLRLKMYNDVKEYVYALSSDDAYFHFHQLQKDARTCYVLFATGFIDFLIISSEQFSQRELQDLGEVKLMGTRSNYIYPTIPSYDYETAIDKIEELSKGEFEKSVLQVEYPGRRVKWKEIDWKLYKLLKYDLTKKYTELARDVKMSYDGFRWSLRRILANSQVIVPYYPEGYSNYFRFYFMLQGEYEEMLIEMFSLISTCIPMYKVNDWILVYFNVYTLELADRFFGILFDLQDRGYIDRIKTAFPISYWHPD
jgi:DNA-binding Lrp family transcriptional regulator